MQGRMLPPSGDRIQSFPVGRWQEEPALVREAGLDALEWIYERSSHDENPLLRAGGTDEIAGVVGAAGVEVSSVCADAFMEEPLQRGTNDVRAGRRRLLESLLGRAAALRAGHVLVPFVDASSLRTEEEEAVAVEELHRVVPAAERLGVELHLETSLPPGRFRALLDRLPSDAVAVCYDVGNSASLGYDTDAELEAYGERIGSVHVKDRVRGGGTVPLGEGDADLPRTFRRLHEVGYDGLLVLQVARGRAGEEVPWTDANRTHVERLWAEGGG
jgi:L-ribulose-5-phosphate 3-epimerase